VEVSAVSNTFTETFSDQYPSTH